MSNSEFGNLSLQLLVLIGAAHLFGHLFTRLRQPRVVGEILAGVLLGPSLLGHLAPSIATRIFAQAAHGGGPLDNGVLAFFYTLGLLLLMFSSGAETRGLFGREDCREICWLSTVGTALPFVVTLLLAPMLPLKRVMGASQQRLPLILIISIAVAVTSIPVISRILHDLGLLQTRFARLVLGVAVIEDIALWAILAIATALATSGAVPSRKVALHVGVTIAYMAAGLFVLPAVLKRMSSMAWNPLATASPIAYVVLVLLAYSAVAAWLEVSLVFAAFLAGFGIASELPHLRAAVETTTRFSFAVFIPLYFAVVGLRLDLSKTFSPALLLGFLALACALKLLAAGMGARLAGFDWMGCLNLAVVTNARGGPGIVLASVAFDAGIINAAFYTTLVLVAVLTSQAAGAWLEYVLRRGWPLLGQSAAAPASEVGAAPPLAT